MRCVRKRLQNVTFPKLAGSIPLEKGFVKFAPFFRQKFYFSILFRYYWNFLFVKIRFCAHENSIFQVYVNFYHPSPMPRRRAAEAPAASFPVHLFPRSGAKNLCGQAGCVPLPPRKAAKTRKALQTLAFLLLHRTLYPLGQQRNAPCALSGRRGRKAASTACHDAKICKFDFLKIHLLKFIYVNLIF